MTTPEHTQGRELTIDELASHAGMTVRNLREWRSLGLLPPPRMRGRVGYYGEDVLERIQSVERLRREGLKLPLIARMLEAGGDAGREVARLAEELRAPAPASRSGAAPELPPATEREIRKHADAIAAALEQLWRVSVWEPLLESDSPREELAALLEHIPALKKTALDAASAILDEALAERIDAGIATEVDRALREP